MIQTFFVDHLSFIHEVTKALNALPTNSDFYIHVELREEGTHRKVGEWSDEIAPDAWYFEAKDADQ